LTYSFPEPHHTIFPLAIARTSDSTLTADYASFTSASIVLYCIVLSLGPLLTAMQYVMYFRFCAWRHVCP